MKRDFNQWFTGGSFIAAGVMFWAGYVLLPHKLGEFFVDSDFAAVHEHFRLWIWLYRVHLFGIAMSAVAVIALAATVADQKSRVVIWPGAGIVTAGAFVAALATAFYYHFGAWGSLEMHDKTPAQVAAYVAALKLDTEFVTCLVRFGRVFGGLGLAILGLGLIRGKVLPVWLGVLSMVIGIGAMGLTMALPDDLDLYAPLFHLHALWLVLTGAVILCKGVTLTAAGGMMQQGAGV